jgi:lysophospholipase L1-like esterase
LQIAGVIGEFAPMTRIFSFGASTAQGALDTEAGGFIVRLGKRLEEQERGLAENFGIGGETTNDMVVRLAEIPVYSRADIAVVTLGINDVERVPDANPQKRVSLQKHADNVRLIIESLESRCQILYVTQYPVDFAKRGLQETLVVSYIDAGRKIAQEIGVDVIDIYSEIDRDKYDAFIADDGMHFNAAGHAYIAERIWSVLFA